MNSAVDSPTQIWNLCASSAEQKLTISKKNLVRNRGGQSWPFIKSANRGRKTSTKFVKGSENPPTQKICYKSSFSFFVIFCLNCKALPHQRIRGARGQKKRKETRRLMVIIHQTPQKQHHRKNTNKYRRHTKIEFTENGAFLGHFIGLD